MALLSSSCAWLSNYKVDREMSKKTCQRHGIIQPKLNDSQNFVKASKLDLSMSFEIKTTKPNLFMISDNETNKEIKMENSSNKENDTKEIMETSIISSC